MYIYIYIYIYKSSVHYVELRPQTSARSAKTGATATNMLSCLNCPEINICLWNCRSIINKLQLTLSYPLTSLFLVSPNLAVPHNYIFDNEIIHPGYFIFHNDRQGNS